MSQISRVPRSLRDAQRTYTKLSRWYDLLANASEGPLRDRGVLALAAQPGERILEIGFGTGHALAAFATAVGPTGSVVGLDISRGMAAVAAGRLERAGSRDTVLLLLADGARLPLAPAAFDAVFLSFTLELFDTPLLPQVLSACRRVLKPNGRLCVVALAKDPRGETVPARGEPLPVRGEPLLVRMYEWAHRMLPRWVDCRPIYVAPLLRAHGFCITAISRYTMWGLPVRIVLAEKAEGDCTDGVDTIPQIHDPDLPRE